MGHNWPMELAMFWIHHCFHAGSMLPNSRGLSTAGRQWSFCFFFCGRLIYLFFCCAGSLLVFGLLSSFSEQSLPSSWVVQASHCCSFSCIEHRILSMQAVGCGMRAQQLWLPGSRAQAQQLCHMGLVASWHVGSSWTRDWTQVSGTWQADSLPLSHQGISRILFLRGGTPFDSLAWWATMDWGILTDAVKTLLYYNLSLFLLSFFPTYFPSL